MKKLAIVTDSNSGISQQEANKLGIYIVPMPFTIDGKEYLEEISISQDEFFALLDKGADVKTSQPSQFYLEQLWEELLKEYESVLFIPMASGLSGTCENAKNYAKKYDGHIVVVDNLRISVPQKLSVYEAIKMAKKGKSAEEIKNYLESTKSLYSIYITPKTLKYLKKGGRITPAAAALGNLLNLKPILTSQGQSFDKFAITMSLGQAKRKMIEKIKSELETEFKEANEQGKIALLAAYARDRGEALKFKDDIEKELGLKVMFVDPLSLSIACHTGPGAIGIGICYYNPDGD